MGGFNFGYPSDDEIWEKISSDDINSRVEGLLDAARKIGMRDNNPLQAFNYLETARELADSLNDFVGVAHAYHLLGAMNSRLKKWDACALAHEAGADAGKRSFRADLEIDHLAFAARAYIHLGDVAAVRRNFELAISMASDSSSWSLPMMQAEYGRFLRKQGDMVLAREYLEAAAVSEDPYTYARASSELVSVLLSAGDATSALTVAREIFSMASYNDDDQMRNKAAYGIAKALIGMELYDAALKEIDVIIESDGSTMKHKVRVDLLRAQALIGLRRPDEALEVYARAIPLLSKFKLWEALGEALVSRGLCHFVMGNALDTEADVFASIAAFEKAGADAWVSKSRLKLAGFMAGRGEWSGVALYSGLVVDNVLQMFSPWYPKALALSALAKAQLGDAASALELCSQLFAVKELSSDVAARGYHAQAIAVGGIKGRNLAAKAVKGYLAAGLVDEATAASALI
jgi:tetratricopeptide (TPR) repeat protein